MFKSSVTVFRNRTNVYEFCFFNLAAIDYGFKQIFGSKPISTARFIGIMVGSRRNKRCTVKYIIGIFYTGKAIDVILYVTE